MVIGPISCGILGTRINVFRMIFLSSGTEQCALWRLWYICCTPWFGECFFLCTIYRPRSHWVTLIAVTEACHL